MIKKSSIRRICVATLALFILLIIYFFPSSDVTIKEHLSYIKKDEMPIFLVDNSNYVARTSIVKSSETINEQIKEIIETLTINSKKGIRASPTANMPTASTVYIFLKYFKL